MTSTSPVAATQVTRIAHLDDSRVMRIVNPIFISRPTTGMTCTIVGMLHTLRPPIVQHIHVTPHNMPARDQQNTFPRSRKLRAADLGQPTRRQRNRRFKNQPR